MHCSRWSRRRRSSPHPRSWSHASARQRRDRLGPLRPLRLRSSSRYRRHRQRKRRSSRLRPRRGPPRRRRSRSPLGRRHLSSRSCSPSRIRGRPSRWRRLFFLRTSYVDGITVLPSRASPLTSLPSPAAPDTSVSLLPDDPLPVPVDSEYIDKCLSPANPEQRLRIAHGVDPDMFILRSAVSQAVATPSDRPPS